MHPRPPNQKESPNYGSTQTHPFRPLPASTKKQVPMNRFAQLFPVLAETLEEYKVESDIVDGPCKPTPRPWLNLSTAGII